MKTSTLPILLLAVAPALSAQTPTTTTVFSNSDNVQIYLCDRVQDSLSLVQLFDSLDGLSWDLSKPMQQWLGVTLSSEGCVEQMNIIGQLRGSVPDIALPNLKTLKLNATWLPDSTNVAQLPDFSGFPNLEELTVISLVKAPAGSSIPDFSHLPKLKTLDFTANEYSGPNTNFSHFPELETLTLFSNNSSGNVPDYNLLPKLKAIEIVYNNSGTVPDFAHLPLLESLTVIGEEEVTGAIPDFQYLPNLKELTLGGSKDLGIVFLAEFTGQIPDFEHLPNLERLSLRYLKQASNVPNFSHLPLLKHLEVTGRYLFGEIPDFDQLPLLESLHIGGYRAWFLIVPEVPRLSQISGAMPDFSHLPELKDLNVSVNSLSGPVPDFNYLPKIINIDVRDNGLSGTIPPFVNLPGSAQEIRLDSNNFDSCAILVTTAEVDVSQNILTFESILPNLPKLSDYKNQDSIPVSPLYFTNGNGNKEIDLLMDENVTGSIYEWYKNGVLIGTTNTNNLELPAPALLSDFFHVRITNSQAPALTLKVKKFRLSEVPPTASFSWEVYLQLCNQYTRIKFTNTSLNSFSWMWIFPSGDPSASTSTNEDVKFTQSGTYNVMLIATNNLGSDTVTLPVTVNILTQPSADFAVETNGSLVTCTANDINATSFFWNFGDGMFSTLGPVVTHTYSTSGTKTITLTVSNSCGSTAMSQTVVITPPTVSIITATPTSGCAPLTVQFTSTVTGNPTSWNWQFPGGTPGTSALQNPSVVYSNPGSYGVILTVSNSAGSNTASITNDITVETTPTTGFTYSSNGLAVDFTNTSTNATSYSWDFGDGTGSMEANPAHTYVAAGTYTVALTATNACGSGTISQTFGLTPTAEPDVASRVKIYPNPNNGHFSLEMNGIKGTREVQLHMRNLTGQLLLSENKKLHGEHLRHDFEAGHLPAGIYFLEIRAGNQWNVKKVVIE